MSNATITDIPGIRVGHFTQHEYATGCTVIICDNAASCAVDIQGDAPGTRETDLLTSNSLVNKVNAILLTGGSAFGLAAADGVMKYCQEKGYGFTMGHKKIPIVPSAVIYDFNLGSQHYAPTAQDGYQACLNATTEEIETGNVGAGTGALVGKVCGIEQSMRGGLGVAGIKFPSGLIISVLVVVNTFGDVRNSQNGIIAGARTMDNNFIDATKYLMDENNTAINNGSNTLIGVVATNAKLNSYDLQKMAKRAQIGVTQIITPAHTKYDGDTFFSLATGEIETDITLVGVTVTELVKKACFEAILKSVGREGIPAYSELI
jgi:L-aminopeptidase/D-esterase-like protein